ncbi:MAG: hypothetical protein HZC41_08710 [Chloroflexi bacterium]|nr:hypothetical protein [Chloroflexota bacterium]
MKTVIAGTVEVLGQVPVQPRGLNLRVQAWDGDNFEPDDCLGDELVARDGTFSIDASQRWQDVEPADQEIPDVYFRVFNGQREIPHWPKGRWEQEGEANSFNVTIKVKAEDLIEPPQVDDETRRFYDDIRGSLAALVTYAPTAYEGDGSGRRSPDSAIEGAVDDAFRDVLGKRIRTEDARSLQSALDRVFSFEEVEGNRIPRWIPPTYSVETELGGEVTGGQASLYHYAHSGVSELKRRAGTFRPLIVDADEDLTHSTRASFLTELDDLLHALGSSIELRPVRIDGSFSRLYDYLQAIEDAFGFKPNNVQTIEDERALTDFRIARQYLDGIRGAWLSYQQEVTLGGRLAHLERLLSVVTESIDEVYAALDAIAVGEAERKVLPLTLNGQRITVAELFDWIRLFASSKAPRILKDGVRDTLPVLRGEAQQLATLVNEVAAGRIPASSPLRHPRVRKAISELNQYLSAVAARLA